jgi:predicted PurR-regulated permease PerM
MENNNESIFGLSITRKLKDDFKTAGIWAMISAIAALVTAVISFVENISNGSYTGFVSLGISILLNVFLLNFGRKIRAAINDDNQEEVNTALNDLRTYFKIYGIITIIAIVLVVLGMIIAFLYSGFR